MIEMKWARHQWRRQNDMQKNPDCVVNNVNNWPGLNRTNDRVSFSLLECRTRRSRWSCGAQPKNDKYKMRREREREEESTKNTKPEHTHTHTAQR